MVNPDKIVRALNRHITKILDAAEAAIPPERYQAFRRIVLRELGKDEFELELNRLYAARPHELNGTDRAGKSLARKEVRHDCL
jgi:hypothetical protein